MNTAPYKQDAIETKAIALSALGAALAGGLVILATPIAVPAIVAVAGIGANATAISAGLIAVSASVGAVAGYFGGNNIMTSEEEIDSKSQIEESHKELHNNLPQLSPEREPTDPPKKSEIVTENREQKITKHFESAMKNDLVFLSLLDKYIEKAIKEILEEDGDLSTKKDRIDRILDPTFTYHVCNSTFKIDDNSEEKKSEIINKILDNADFSAISDNDHQDLLEKETSSPRRVSDAIERLLIFMLFVNEIFRITSATDDEKTQALKAFITQHSISGSPEYDSTLEEQKTYKIEHALDLTYHVSKNPAVHQAVDNFTKVANMHGYKVDHEAKHIDNAKYLVAIAAVDYANATESHVARGDGIEPSMATDIVSSVVAKFEKSFPKALKEAITSVAEAATKAAADHASPPADAVIDKQIEKKIFDYYFVERIKLLAQNFLKEVNYSKRDGDDPEPDPAGGVYGLRDDILPAPAPAGRRSAAREAAPASRPGR